MDSSEQLAIQKMLSAMQTYRASSVHLSAGNVPMMRVAGKLTPVPEQAIIVAGFIDHVATEWLSSAELEQLQRDTQITVAKTLNNRKRLKLSLFYQQGTLALVLTGIRDVAPTLEELRLPSAVTQLAAASGGLVLFVGPHDGGMELTMAACIEYLNQHEQKHIVTLERPVGVLFNDNRSIIEQREIGRDVPSLQAGLRATSEEDVDVVAVFDHDTAAALSDIIATAQSGKTVFMIVEAHSLVAAIDTILRGAQQHGADVRRDVAAVFAGAIHQRCVFTSSGDAVTIAGVMIPTQPVRAIIQSGDVAQINNVLLTSHSDTMRSIDQALSSAVQEGLITREQAKSQAEDQMMFS